MYKSKVLSIFFLLCFATGIFSQTGYEIKVTIEGFEGKTAILGFRRADQSFIVDTVEVKDGKCVFQGSEKLATGIYLVLLPPNNDYFEFLLTPKEQRFSMKTVAPDYVKNLHFEGAEDNQIFYDYRLFLKGELQKSDALQAVIGNEQDAARKKKLEAQLQELADVVETRQKALIRQHPQTFTAELVAAFLEPKVPDPPLKPNGMVDETFQFRYYREHFFDHFDFTESGFVNTPYLKEKIDRYLDKLTVQSPDSVNASVDYILGKAIKNRKVFEYTLPYLLNKYYRPRIVGMDAVFVHLAEKYYKSGVADWVKKDELKKILDDAYMIKGVLIGNQAPDVHVQLYDYKTQSWTDKMINLYDVKSDFTVVFIWKPGCSHCRKATDEMKEFYAKYKEKGVEIFGITTARYRDLDKAVEEIKFKKPTWITTADPYMKARALQKYYATTLPKIYLLDKDKTIIASRVAVSQLGEIIDEIRG